VKPIRAATVLPAHRTRVELRTEDGLKLVGELAMPLRPARATLIMVHPLTVAGGAMDSHVLSKVANRLPALADLAVFRFNLRGAASFEGCSEGQFDDGQGEQLDVRAAIELAVAQELPNPWLVGWSFGAELALKCGPDQAVVGAVLIAPPLFLTTAEDLASWDRTGKPLHVVVPEYDDFLRPAQARQQFAPVRQATVVTLEETGHGVIGEPSVRRVLDEIVSVVAPQVPTPLPTQFSAG
jgi:alpha/beta superfamily hydrolase